MKTALRTFALLSLLAACGHDPSGSDPGDAGGGSALADSGSSGGSDGATGATDAATDAATSGVPSDAADPCDGTPPDGGDTCGSGKTLLCHYPPGNPGNRHDICVGTPSVPAHQAHGDTLGDCH